jgi:ferredoxin
MEKRKVIAIDEAKCTGCGLCLPNCPEGALRILDGKARLVGDLFCDGLGACLGYCPEGAITVEERNAEPYDERKVMEGIVKQGPGVIAAHLEHLASHGEDSLHALALDFLAEKGIAAPPVHEASSCCGGPAQPRAGGCPGSRSASWDGKRPDATRSPAVKASETAVDASGTAQPEPSALRQWPIQLHLLSPMAAHFQDRDLLLAADCTAFALGAFHRDWLEGRALAIGCPKLDDGLDVYREKITALIDHAQVRSITVLMMEVPCCGGLLQLVQEARAQAKRKVAVKAVVVAIRDGAVLEEREA